uniref:Uncharacterized protein n=1 Tax=Kalanchoe fedtschenkoi TaxID=63787 RepID=A0A7N0VHC1_KALFE
MSKQLRNMRSLREVAPALIVYPLRSSSCPNLETIFEEAESLNFQKNSKWVLAALPLLISMLSYALLSRNLMSYSR